MRNGGGVFDVSLQRNSRQCIMHNEECIMDNATSPSHSKGGNVRGEGGKTLIII